jgi:hypothetical protein
MINYSIVAFYICKETDQGMNGKKVSILVEVIWTKRSLRLLLIRLFLVMQNSRMFGKLQKLRKRGNVNLKNL